jgi:hypothetical protein
LCLEFTNIHFKAMLYHDTSIHHAISICLLVLLWMTLKSMANCTSHGFHLKLTHMINTGTEAVSRLRIFRCSGSHCKPLSKVKPNSPPLACSLHAESPTSPPCLPLLPTVPQSLSSTESVPRPSIPPFLGPSVRSKLAS